jgi:hypothetical protein
MAHFSRPSNGTQGSFQHAPPVEPEQLRFAVELAGSVAAGRTPAGAMTGDDLTADVDRPVLGGLRFCETVEDHMSFALLQQFWPDRELFFSVLFRLRALNHILCDNVLDQMIEDPNPQSERVRVRKEVLEVAAKMPLDSSGEFHRQEFLSRVRQLLEQAT